MTIEDYIKLATAAAVGNGSRFLGWAFGEEVNNIVIPLQNSVLVNMHSAQPQPVLDDRVTLLRSVATEHQQNERFGMAAIAYLQAARFAETTHHRRDHILDMYHTSSTCLYRFLLLLYHNRETERLESGQRVNLNNVYHMFYGCQVTLIKRAIDTNNTIRILSGLQLLILASNLMLDRYGYSNDLKSHIKQISHLILSARLDFNSKNQELFRAYKNLQEQMRVATLDHESNGSNTSLSLR